MPLLPVLDQSPVRSGGTPADAIHESLELAELADRLGYHRYWLAEHHSTPGLGGSSPEVLIGQVAARTSRIRVGAGGVMLRSEEHTSELQSRFDLVCRLLLEKKKLLVPSAGVVVGQTPASGERTLVRRSRTRERR